jgi:uncharacterized RDD family membrane protein YckC
MDEAINQSTSVSTLSDQETRKILTPFAFEIDKSLFGLPLASPTKRVLAILIDMLFIALLSETPGEILALVIAITLYRLGGKKRALKLGKHKGKKRRKVLKVIAIFIVFVVLLQVLPALLSPSTFEQESSQPNRTNIANSELSTRQAIVFSALSGAMLLTLNSSECVDLACWKKELSPLVKPFSSINLNGQLINEAIAGITEATELNQEERTQLTQHLTDIYLKELQQKTKEENTVVNAEKATEVKTKSTETSANNIATDRINDSEKPNVQDSENENETPPVYSIMEWIKGLIEDLGLGFGWAAFYFTVFTALWHGQTPGKKTLGIRVLQLDGTPLSLWDSFGRYGGYGAGLATGLLGFIQVFWNANRQAIQDQISATVVIDDRKKMDKQKANNEGVKAQ